jgi:hypothetical protein
MQQECKCPVCNRVCPIFETDAQIKARIESPTYVECPACNGRAEHYRKRNPNPRIESQ